ncbi:hypothetical protein Tco_1324396 [Tanacetum coccineum]
MAPLSYLKTPGQTSRRTVIELSTTLEETYHKWLSRISKPSPRTNEFGDWVKLSDPKQALRGWKGLKRQKEAKTVKNRQETGKRQRVKSKTKKSARNHSRISPTQSKKAIKAVKAK